MTVNTKKSPPL